MGGRRQEDIRVKLPAVIHLTRLGYRYLPRALAQRDRDTNILTEVFRSSVERINGVRLSEEAFRDLLEEIHRTLALDDLGERFFDGLRNSWRGLRLLDFARPENNTFQVMTELLYASGSSRFRPDITLLVNGLPLAFIEVKNRRPGSSIRSEVNRMVDRSRKKELRRFINETQIMVFSDDADADGEDLLPLKGAFYATAAYDDFVFHPFEEDREAELRVAPSDPEEEALILRDNRLEELEKDPSFRAFLSPDTPTHRMLTSLFHTRRLLFFLRYGITYLEEEQGDGGQRRVSKQILRSSQLFSARSLEKHLHQAPGGILCVPGSGKAAMTGLQLRCLTDYFSRQGIRGLFFYLADREERLRQLREEFLRRGFRVAEARAEELFPPAVLREDGWMSPPAPLITLVNIRSLVEVPLASLAPGPERRVYFLDEIRDGYDAGPSFLARLRAADPEAILIAFSFSSPEDRLLSGSTLLFAGRIPGKQEE